MDTSCQASYPLNSENASPPGTFKLYLSWANRALPPKVLTSAVMIAIVRMQWLFTSSSFVQVGGLDFLPDGGRCARPEPEARKVAELVATGRASTQWGEQVLREVRPDLASHRGADISGRAVVDAVVDPGVRDLRRVVGQPGKAAGHAGRRRAR